MPSGIRQSDIFSTIVIKIIQSNDQGRLRENGQSGLAVANSFVDMFARWKVVEQRVRRLATALDIRRIHRINALSNGTAPHRLVSLGVV